MLKKLKKAIYSMPLAKSILFKSLLFLALVFVFQESYYFNFLGLTTGIAQFAEFEQGGDAAVQWTMARTLRDGPAATGGFLVGADSSGQTQLDSPPYLSSFGLQGKVMARAVRWQGGHVARTAEGARFYLALATATLMSLFTLYVLGEFGWMPAMLFVAGANLSVWMVFAARNIYLLYILKLLPFLFSMMLFPWCMKGSRKRFVFLAAGIGILSLVASLCLFDYASNMVLGVAVAPIYYGISRGIPRRIILRWALGLLLAAAGGVAVAILATVGQIARWQESLPQAIDYLRHVVATRAYADGDPVRSAADLSLWQVWAGYDPLPVLALPFGSPNDFHIALSWHSACTSWLVLAALAFLDGRRFPAFERDRPRLVALAAASGWALLATISWGFLMKGHMAHHYHINGMIFTLPFLLVQFIFAGAVLATVTRHLTPSAPLLTMLPKN